MHMVIELMNIHEVNIEDLKAGVSDSRLKKASRYANHADLLRSLCVEYLLNQMIRKNHPDYPTPVTLMYDEKGKPHLKNKDGSESIFISLSHSGDYVACMLDSVPCGIDIEICKEKHFKKIASRICTDNELPYIKSISDFYNIWTLKEAVLKATGMGLSLDMRSFEIGETESRYETYAADKKYSGQVVSKISSYPAGYSLSYMRLID